MDREDVFKHAQGTLVSWLLGSMVAFAGVGAGQTAAALWGIVAAVAYLTVAGVVIYRSNRHEGPV